MVERIPPGTDMIIPHLRLSDCAAAIEFYKVAFGGEEVCRIPAADGRRILHAAMQMLGQLVFMADDFPEFCGGKAENPLALAGTPVTLHRYVENCDAAVDRALQAGATIVMPATDMFWGDRYGAVKDPFGHVWAFATHIKDMTPEEMTAAATAAMSGPPPK